MEKYKTLATPHTQKSILCVCACSRLYTFTVVLIETGHCVENLSSCSHTVFHSVNALFVYSTPQCTYIDCIRSANTRKPQARLPGYIEFDALLYFIGLKSIRINKSA